ncbi:hypothetical protein [Falsibacillus albus]|uniref:Uncharacterized protein n=1 Tax=Falsibacillus albus TaxID=2478915 RepID=A0A3L7K5A6_9BACI|nr:hypothetical protein [Falsibacillus albus]RLQ95892.1 hypothetical protein D9X91_09760 [Falsibacillus albus]
MPSIQDALYNYLTIYYVSRARPEDTAAKTTLDFFSDMLMKEFNIPDWTIEEKEHEIIAHCSIGNSIKNYRFPKELISCMLQQMEEYPERYA